MSVVGMRSQQLMKWASAFSAMSGGDTLFQSDFGEDLLLLEQVSQLQYTAGQWTMLVVLQQVIMVDSDDGMKDEDLEESGNETDEEYDELQDEGDAEYIIGIEQEPANRLKADDEYVFEVLTAEEVVGLIQEIIRDVNTVVQVIKV